MRVLVSRHAEQELRRLPRDVRRRFVRAFSQIASEPDPRAVRLDLKPLEGHPHRVRLRVGEYRAVFEVVEDEWRLLTVGHRSTVYRP